MFLCDSVKRFEKDKNAVSLLLKGFDQSFLEAIYAIPENYPKKTTHPGVEKIKFSYFVFTKLVFKIMN